MRSDIAIIVAEDNEGHAVLIERNLRRGEIGYPIIHLRDGEEALNFFYRRGDGPHREEGVKYVLLLDITMPKVSGVDILRELKKNEELKGIPIIMITTTDNPSEIERCYSLGCADFITKNIDYGQFALKIRELGKKIRKMEFPVIG